MALMSYYVVCKAVTSLDEIEEMEGELFLPAFRKLRFVDVNKPFWKRLLHRSFQMAKKRCDRWGDFVMHVAPYEADKPIYYEFTRCPTAEFAREHGLLEVMPALCNPDFKGMELLHARLVRTTTCANGCKCDYAICGDRDPSLKEHPEYRDAQGYQRHREEVGDEVYGNAHGDVGAVSQILSDPFDVGIWPDAGGGKKGHSTGEREV